MKKKIELVILLFVLVINVVCKDPVSKNPSVYKYTVNPEDWAIGWNYAIKLKLEPRDSQQDIKVRLRKVSGSFNDSGEAVLYNNGSEYESKNYNVGTSEINFYIDPIQDNIYGMNAFFCKVFPSGGNEFETGTISAEGYFQTTCNVSCNEDVGLWWESSSGNPDSYNYIEEYVPAGVGNWYIFSEVLEEYEMEEESDYGYSLQDGKYRFSVPAGADIELTYIAIPQDPADLDVTNNNIPSQIPYTGNDYTVRVNNCGDETLYWDTSSIPTWASCDPENGSINDGNYTTVTITFDSYSGSSFRNGNLKFYNTQNSSDCEWIYFTQEAAPSSHLVIEPLVYDFGDQIINTSSEIKTFILENTGNATASGSISLYGNDSNHFHIVSGGESYSLEHDETQNIDVLFHPTSLNEKNIILFIDGDTNDIEVDLSGNCITNPVPLPEADFYAEPITGSIPLQTLFYNDSIGEIDNYEWNFGDGNTSTYENPFHIYTSSGFYTVSLTATGPGGSNIEIKEDYIHVYNDAINLPVPFKAQYPPGTSWSETRNCGQASCAMIFSYYNSSEPTAQDIMDIDYWLYETYGDPIRNYNGSYTNTEQLKQVAIQFGGFDSEIHGNWDWDITNLENELQNNYPVIVAVRIGMLPSGGGHFMVLIGMDDDNVYVHDPGRSLLSGFGQNMQYPKTQFLDSWDSQNNACVTIHGSIMGSPPLGVPQSLVAEVLLPDSLVLGWCAPFGQIPDFYNIYKNYSLLTTVNNDQLVYLDTNVGIGIEQNYYVTSLINSTESAASNIVYVTIPLESPDNVTIDVNDSFIILSWDKVENSTAYKVYVSDNPNLSYPQDITSTGFFNQVEDRVYWLKVNNRTSCKFFFIKSQIQ